MSENGLLNSLREAVMVGDAARAEELAKEVVAEGIDPLMAYDVALRDGITEVGDQFSRFELFLPDLVIAADAMKAAAAILEQEIQRAGGERKSQGKVVLGTVAGDLHDIGKTIVATLLSSHGFEVIDLGVNVSRDTFVQAVRDEKPQILGMSSLLTITAKELRNVIEALTEAGLRHSVQVIVGGGAVTQEFAEAIGADGYGRDAALGVRAVKRLVGIS